jgi:hypothetical protein
MTARSVEAVSFFIDQCAEPSLFNYQRRNSSLNLMFTIDSNLSPIPFVRLLLDGQDGTFSQEEEKILWHSLQKRPTSVSTL